MMMRALFFSLLMAGVALTSAAVAPAYHDAAPAPDLEAALPGDFGEWRRERLPDAVLPPEVELGPGEAVVYRAWRDRAGRLVTLVVAYGPPLGDSVRLHRPETCYRAQGFAVTGLHKDEIPGGADALPVMRMDSTRALREEAVTYWLRDGDAYAASAPVHEMLFFRRGLAAPSDGALVRVSSSGAGEDGAFQLHDEFIKDFLATLPENGRRLLLAEPS